MRRILESDMRIKTHGRLLFELTTLAYPIRVYRKGKLHAVQYGRELRDRLTVADAQQELGACIFHAVKLMKGNDDGLETDC